MLIMRKTKVPMNKPYNIQNTNICNGIFQISFLKALLINEGETTRGEMTQNEPTHGANRIRGETTRIPLVHSGQVSGFDVESWYEYNNYTVLLFAIFMN
jgi:hypothetical protein